MLHPINRYFVLHKPRNMVSQFVSSHQVALLGEINFDFPEGTHAIGRLDNDSEGLLLLTTDKSITRRLFHGEKPHTRTYLVQVKNIITEETIERLRSGIPIRIKGGEFYITTPCEVSIVTNPEDYVQIDRDKIEYNASSWVMITLTEGKYHQVRKMVKTVGHRCKRLIRVAIEDIKLADLAPGEVREMHEGDFIRLLKL